VDVYLVPVRPAGHAEASRFALYCEPAPEPIEPEVVGGPKPSLAARLKRSFNRALAEGEAERRRQEAGEPASEGGSRMARAIRQRLAHAVAEHRLLWTLRHQTSARLLHPATLPGDRALALALDEFKRDYTKHQFWCIVDALIVVASAPIAIIPGPNFLAYYFIFRSVAHYFSWLGARRGRDRSTWTLVASDPLARLDAASVQSAEARDVVAREVEAALGLERLVPFLRRVARP
jgi:hypothetical protein